MNSKNSTLKFKTASLIRPGKATAERLSEDASRLASEVLATPLLQAGSAYAGRSQVRIIHAALYKGGITTEQLEALMQGTDPVPPISDSVRMQATTVIQLFRSLETMDLYSAEEFTFSCISMLTARAKVGEELIPYDRDKRRQLASQLSILHGHLPELMDWAQKSPMPPLLKGSIFCAAVLCHTPDPWWLVPVCWLWFTGFLRQWEPALASLPVSAMADTEAGKMLIRDLKNRRTANTPVSLWDYAAAFLKLTRQALLEAQSAVSSTGRRRVDRASKQRMVMEFLETHLIIQNRDLRENFGFSASTASRTLRDLCDRGLLTRTRGGHGIAYRRS